MKKASRNKARGELRSEYDFSKGVRGKYAKRYAQGTNVVRLAPDVSAAFPDAESVNEALRVLIRIASKSAMAGREQNQQLTKARNE